MSDMQHIVSNILELSPPVALLFALNVVGYLLKKSPVPSWLIPWALIILGGSVYPFIVEDGQLVYNSRHPEVFAVLIGCCIGGAAVGIYEGVSNFMGRKEANTRSMPDNADK